MENSDVVFRSSLLVGGVCAGGGGGCGVCGGAGGVAGVGE